MILPMTGPDSVTAIPSDCSCGVYLVRSIKVDRPSANSRHQSDTAQACVDCTLTVSRRS
jgi:hypothetical protein